MSQRQRAGALQARQQRWDGTHRHRVRTHKGKRRTLVRAAQDGSRLGALVVGGEVQRETRWVLGGGCPGSRVEPIPSLSLRPTSASLIGRPTTSQHGTIIVAEALAAQDSLCSTGRASSRSHVPRHSSLPPRGTVLPSAPDPLLPRGLHCTSCIHTFHTAKTNPH
jgi:hypothetical protein